MTSVTIKPPAAVITLINPLNEGFIIEYTLVHLKYEEERHNVIILGAGLSTSGYIHSPFINTNLILDTNHNNIEFPFNCFNNSILNNATLILGCDMNG